MQNSEPTQANILPNPMKYWELFMKPFQTVKEMISQNKAPLDYPEILAVQRFEQKRGPRDAIAKYILYLENAGLTDDFIACAPRHPIHQDRVFFQMFNYYAGTDLIQSIRDHKDWYYLETIGDPYTIGATSGIISRDFVWPESGLRPYHQHVCKFLPMHYLFEFDLKVPNIRGYAENGIEAYILTDFIYGDQMIRLLSTKANNPNDFLQITIPIANF